MPPSMASLLTKRAPLAPCNEIANWHIRRFNSVERNFPDILTELGQSLAKAGMPLRVAMRPLLRDSVIRSTSSARTWGSSIAGRPLRFARRASSTTSLILKSIIDKPPACPPVAPRSNVRVAIATFQPSPSLPIRQEAGIRASLKNV